MAGNNNYNKNKNSGSNSVAKISADFGKVPPQAIEFEETVLGALMLEKDAIHSVVDILKPECFYHDGHGKIFAAILQLSLDHNPIDIHTVGQQLKVNGTIDEIGGPFYLAQLTNKVASTAHIEFHARIIAQKYVQRELIKVGSDIQRRAFEETEDVADMLDTAEQDLFNIAEGNIKKEVSKVDVVIREAIELIEEAGKRPDGLSGVPSGFTALDRMTSGWQTSDLIIIAARPAMGKTAFVLSMARNIAVDHKRPIAVFSLEMSNVQLVNRLISSEVELPGEKLKNGQLQDWEWKQLEQKIHSLEEAPIFVDDTPALSVFEFRAKLRRLVMQQKVEIAVVDYLQLMTSPGAGNRVEEVSIISRSLKAIAKELSIPIVALSQLSRAVEQRAGDKRPQLSDLRESGAIEQDADMVLFIHRPEYYGLNQDESGNSLIGMAELIIAKHRSGSIGDVMLRFKKEFTRFMDPEEQFGLPSPEGGGNFQSKMNADDGPKNDNPAAQLANDKSFENSGLDVNQSFDEVKDSPF